MIDVAQAWPVFDGPSLHLPSIAWPFDACCRDRKPAVSVRWTGAAGFCLQCGPHTLLIDPFLSRPSLAHAALLLRPNPHWQFVPQRVDGIIASHTHFDHALDIPSIAARTGAKVAGSSSLSSLMQSASIAMSHVFRPDDAAAQQWEVGPFRVRSIASTHSPLVFGQVPLSGEIQPAPLPWHWTRYRCGQVLAFEIEAANRRLLHIGSAALPNDMRAIDPVDVLLLCVSGWRSTPGFVAKAMHWAKPKAVVLSHWDNFLLPVWWGARPLVGMRATQLVHELLRADPDVKIGTIRLGSAIGI